MKTHFQKSITCIFFFICFNWCMPISMHAMSQDDIEAFAILPSSPSDHNGVIDLVLNSNTDPYNIKYFKDDGTGIFNLVYEITATENGAGEDFESASLGNYRIEIQDNYCGAIVLNVTLSLECNCTVPILNFEASQCVLTWDEVCNELGQGFEYSWTYRKICDHTKGVAYQSWTKSSVVVPSDLCLYSLVNLLY